MEYNLQTITESLCYTPETNAMLQINKLQQIKTFKVIIFQKVAESRFLN